MSKILDTNHDVTLHLDALIAAGITTVIRYLSPINPDGEKCIKPDEAHAIASAGLRLGLVCEGWGDFAHGGISYGAGERDGQWCVDYATKVGAPEKTCIYYAVDVDATTSQINRLVIPYFQAIAIAHKGSNLRIGTYGSGTVIMNVVHRLEIADLGWLSCSLGWSGSRSYLETNKWAMRQHPPQIIAGLDTDPDDANGDIGDFIPFAPEA
jgi:hypothetical protein